MRLWYIPTSTRVNSSLMISICRSVSGASIELPLLHALSHDVLDDVANLLGRRLVEHARRRLDAVGEHHDRRLGGLRQRAGIDVVAASTGSVSRCRARSRK